MNTTHNTTKGIGHGVAGRNLRPRFRTSWVPASVLSGRLYAAHRLAGGMQPAAAETAAA